jgi:hypothetical protein
MNSICSICSREYVYSRKSGHSKNKCNSCYVNKRRFSLKEKSVDYLGGCCSLCGYSKCVKALEFHHLDPSRKEFTISGSHSRSWGKIKNELDKCILLCANCHREKH